MNIFEISSTSNEKFKHIKALRKKKQRDESDEFVVEGYKNVAEAAKSDFTIKSVVFFSELNLELDCPCYKISESMFSALSDTKSPQGILAIVSKKNIDFNNIKKGSYVYCDNVSDPGNLGTIIRTADGAGFSGVLLSPNCVDLYNPKTIRATMGSVFHISISCNVDYELIKNSGLSIYSGILSDKSVDYRSVQYGKDFIICVGNEANGISAELAQISIPIIIPIYGSAESLNASVAASLMIYEAANQQHKLAE